MSRGDGEGYLRWDCERALAYLVATGRAVDTRISEIYREKGLVYEPQITLWDVNIPEILARVCDGFELQMMGIRGAK